MSDEVLKLVRDQMDRAADEMRRIIEQDFFKPGLFDPVVRTPPTWQQRLRRKWARITGYFTTLWQALRGDDLVSPADYDDW